jgi:hypothetical protein
MMQPCKLNSELRFTDPSEAVQDKNLLPAVLPMWEERAFKVGHLYWSFNEFFHFWDTIEAKDCSVLSRIYIIV